MLACNVSWTSTADRLKFSMYRGADNGSNVSGLAVFDCVDCGTCENCEKWDFVGFQVEYRG